MELFVEIEKKIEEELKKYEQGIIKKEAQNLSKRYCEEERNNQNFIPSAETALAYAIIRMPATFYAVQTVLQEWKERTKSDGETVQTILDLGAGTGAASLALREVFEEAEITLIEREPEMVRLSKIFLYSPQENKMKWIMQDLLKQPIPQKADFLLASYLCNEWKKQDRINFVKQMFEKANQFVVLVEPGTPESFRALEDIKLIGKEYGFMLLAPCPYEGACHLEKDDWCHTICRLPRSKIQRNFKQGELAYEDEKFSYLIFSKQQYQRAERRILRKPILEKNCVKMKICTKDEITEIKITKKEKERYKQARKKKMRRNNLGESDEKKQKIVSFRKTNLCYSS